MLGTSRPVLSFFCHEKWVGCDPGDYAEVVGLSDPLNVCRVDKEIHNVPFSNDFFDL